MYLSHVFVWNQNRACAPLHKKAENSWKRRIQASKFITKHACIGRTYLRWKRFKSRVDMPASTPTRPLHWREPHCEFVALNLEALDVKIALDFRAFVLQICTLYTIKKNEGHNRRPHLVSRIPLLIPASISSSCCMPKRNKYLPIRCTVKFHTKPPLSLSLPVLLPEERSKNNLGVFN